MFIYITNNVRDTYRKCKRISRPIFDKSYSNTDVVSLKKGITDFWVFGINRDFFKLTQIIIYRAYTFKKIEYNLIVEAKRLVLPKC